MSDRTQEDLNAVIAGVVQAHMKTELAALMAQHVGAALYPGIRDATRAAVAKVLVEEAPAFEAAVAREIQRNIKVELGYPRRD